jgi:hypothetical protein
MVPGGFGSPSSVAEPLKVALNTDTVWSGPALTTGRLLTVMTTVSLAESPPSLALSLMVYTPPTEKVAVVFGALISAKLMVPGPLALLHV